MSAFEFAYTLWVFVSTLGVVQLAAVRSRLWGLVVFRRWPRATEAASVLLVIAAFAWFFASGERNVPDTAEGLDGVVQARWFAIGGAAAVALLITVSSVVNHRWGADHSWDPQTGQGPPAGLTWLERTTFARAAAARVQSLRRERSRAAKGRR